MRCALVLFFFAMYNAIQNTWKKPMLRAHFCNNELQKPAKLWPQCLATPFIPSKKYYWRLRPTAVHSSDEKLDTCHRRVGYVNNIRAPSSCFFYAKLSSPRRLCMNVSFFARLSNLTSVYIRKKKKKTPHRCSGRTTTGQSNPRSRGESVTNDTLRCCQ